MPRPRARIVTAMAVCALALAACGGDEKEPADAPAANQAEAAPSQEDLEAEVRTTIEDYFTAMRVADTEAICALETDELQQFKYNGTGQACLDDLANNTKQFYDKKTVIKLGTVTDSGASATVDGGLGATSVGLVRADGEWLINAFS